MFVILIILFVINVPIAIALGLTTISIFWISGDVPLITLPQRMFAALDSFPLMAAPFFILAGKLMEHGGISEKIVEFAKSLVGQLKGGLAHVSILTCVIFAALSGSGAATTAAVGAVMITAMVKEGYNRNFSSAIQAAGGTTGMIIPPSVPLVMYGVSAGTSISDLFIAGLMPGLLIGLSLMLVAFIISKKEGYGASIESTSFKRIAATSKDAFLALLMPVIILGGIYGGIFTPTEASVIAVVYGFFVGFFIYRRLTLDVIRTILVESSITSSVILFIISTASLFGLLITREQIPQSFANLFVTLDLSPILIILLINLFLLIVGTFLETIAAIIILTPILLPVAVEIGVDPVHFGIIMAVNLSIGLITPPVGVSLFVASQVGKTKYEGVVRAILPFLLMMIVNLLLITFIPALSIGLVGR